MMATLRRGVRRFVLLIGVFAPLVAATTAPVATAAPRVPACALGGGSAGPRAFYATELERAERRFQGNRRVFSAGVAAYVYGLAPVAVRQTVRRFPENNLVSIAALVDPSVRVVVLPNHDTTYTVGRLNLASGPLVIDVPDTGGRYYVIQLLDAYSNTFSYIGRRTTGTKRGSFAIVPRGYDGALPKGVRRIESPTNLIWVIGRTLIRDESDLPAATDVMSAYTVTGLDEWRAGARRPSAVLPAFPPLPELPIPKGVRFFDALGVALAESPPPRGDACALRAFAAAGIGPGKLPSSDASGSARTALEAATRAGARLVRRAERRQNRRSRTRNNGWLIPGRYIGNYGRNWLGRGIVALTALGANTTEETVYPLALTDSRGRPLHGRHRYRLRFPRVELPPVGAFWSLTAYGDDLFLVDNPIDRYAIGDRTRGLLRGRDGSLTIHIQHRPPRGAARANWLPIPSGRFRLLLRLYEPRQSALTGRWLPPPLRRR
jgi:hypothetical protein